MTKQQAFAIAQAIFGSRYGEFCMIENSPMARSAFAAAGYPIPICSLDEPTAQKQYRQQLGLAFSALSDALLSVEGEGPYQQLAARDAEIAALRDRIATLEREAAGAARDGA